MPSLRQLEYLVAIADERHFRRAAERANTTQPTLSEQLKALELRLGAQLVERSRARVLLTPLGEDVVAIARRMLADAAAIRSIAAGQDNKLGGVIKLGLPPTIGPHLLPRAVPLLRRAYPDLKLYVREELPSGLVDALLEGRHDLVLTFLPLRTASGALSTAAESPVVAEALAQEPLHVAVPLDHPLAQTPAPRLKDLKGADVLALARGHQLHDQVSDLCDAVGARLRLDYEGTSLDTLREMVAMGLGITVLPGLYVRTVACRDPNIRLLQFADRPLSRTLAIGWRRTVARGDRFQQLAKLFRDLLADTMGDTPATGRSGGPEARAPAAARN